MTGTELIIITVVVIALLWYIRYNYTKNETKTETKTEGMSDIGYSSSSVPCGSNVGRYYTTKYKAESLYNPLSQDAQLYYDTVRRMQNETYTDPSGSSHSRAITPSPTNATDVNKPYVYNKADISNVHPAMLTDAKNRPLKASDLLPDPCMGKGKDWTSVYAGCENLVGGQNFVHLEDEHFSNEVLDTRCTKYMSTDLRKEPAIQYANVSIWNKPSVCKNAYNYIRPGLDD